MGEEVGRVALLSCASSGILNRAIVLCVCAVLCVCFFLYSVAVVTLKHCILATD